MDTLHTGEALDELLGGYRWTTQSHIIQPDGSAPFTSHSLVEAWPSEAHALHCAKIRVSQGYRVDAFLSIAASAAGGG